MKYYRVVEWNHDDSLNVLSASLSSFEEALSFKNNEYCRKYHTDAFIVVMLFGNKEED